MLQNTLSSNSQPLRLSKDLGKVAQQADSEQRRHGLLLGQWLLEMPELQAHRGEIAEALALLRTGSAGNLPEALGFLRHQIHALLPKGVATLVFSASCESSPFLFAQGVVAIARAYRREGDFATPASLYSMALQALPNSNKCEDFRKQLEGELAALQGGGSFSDSLKLGLERASHELKSPMVLAMAAGSLAGPLSSRLLGNVLRGRVSQLARVVLSRTVGMGADVAAFTSVQHGMALASGQPTNTFSHDLLHAGLMLTSLRVTGTLARTVLRTQAAQSVLRNFGRLARKTTEASLPLFAEYQGILRANYLGAELGIGEVGPHAGLEAVFTMGHFRIANAYLRLPPHYTKLHHHLTLETETTLRDTSHRALQSLEQARWRAPSLKQRSGLSFATAHGPNGAFGPGLMKQGRIDASSSGSPRLLSGTASVRWPPKLDNPATRLQGVLGSTLDMWQQGINGKRQSRNSLSWNHDNKDQTKTVADIIQNTVEKANGQWVIAVANNKQGEALLKALGRKGYHLIPKVRGNQQIAIANNLRKALANPKIGQKHLIVCGAMVRGFEEMPPSIAGSILTYQILAEFSHENLSPLFPSSPREGFHFVEFDYGHRDTKALGKYYADYLERAGESDWRLKSKLPPIVVALAKVQTTRFYQEQLSALLTRRVKNKFKVDAIALSQYLDLIASLRSSNISLLELESHVHRALWRKFLAVSLTFPDEFPNTWQAPQGSPHHLVETFRIDRLRGKEQEAYVLDFVNLLMQQQARTENVPYGASHLPKFFRGSMAQYREVFLREITAKLPEDKKRLITDYERLVF